MNDTPRTVFNYETFLANFQGIESLVDEVIESFLMIAPELLINIERAIHSKNPKSLELAAHTLKGAVSNFYAESACALAQTLETQGKHQTFDCPELVFENLKMEIHALELELKKLLSSERVA